MPCQPESLLKTITSAVPLNSFNKSAKARNKSVIVDCYLPAHYPAQGRIYTRDFNDNQTHSTFGSLFIVSYLLLGNFTFSGCVIRGHGWHDQPVLKFQFAYVA